MPQSIELKKYHLVYYTPITLQLYNYYVVDYSQLMLGSDVMIIMHVHGASMICGYQVFIVKKWSGT